MTDIEWGEIKVTIEKIEDPSVLNAVKELYEKAWNARLNVSRYRCEIQKAYSARKSFGNEEEYKVLVNEFYRSMEAAREERNRDKKERLWQEATSRNEKREISEEESKRKYDEIHGMEYDMLLEKFAMYSDEELMFLEKAEKVLNESGINSEAARELKEEIEKRMPINRSYKENILSNYARV